MQNYITPTFPSTVKDIPSSTKYIVLVNSSYSEAGYYKDDPSTCTKYVRTVCFDSKDTMEEWVIYQYKDKLSEVQILEYSPVLVQKEIKFIFQ